LRENQEHSRRLESRRERALERAHKRRRAAIAASISLIVLVVLAVGGWFAWTRLRKPPAPEHATFRVTLPEGLDNGDVAGRVSTATKGSITEEEFDVALEVGGYDYDFLEGAGGNLEGFLFPDTYEMTSETTPGEAVDMMLSDFARKTEDLEWSRAQSLGVTPHQIVTIASIIEKEVSRPEERPLVASVIYNRLNGNMKLGMCSTVLYALGEWKPELSIKDTEVDSPYNTYRIEGLPPGPICNPGFESIRAALYPASTDYLYFILTGPDGKTSFTSDYQQFERWKSEQNGKQ
jgi:UPF0755 protein